MGDFQMREKCGKNAGGDCGKNAGKMRAGIAGKMREQCGKNAGNMRDDIFLKIVIWYLKTTEIGPGTTIFGILVKNYMGFRSSRPNPGSESLRRDPRPPTPAFSPHFPPAFFPHLFRIQKLFAKT